MTRPSCIACRSRDANLFSPGASAPKAASLRRPCARLDGVRNRRPILVPSYWSRLLFSARSVRQAMRLAAPRMKSIVVAHGIEVWEPLSTLRRRALRRSNLILTPTQDTADHLATQQQG